MLQRERTGVKTRGVGGGIGRWARRWGIANTGAAALAVALTLTFASAASAQSVNPFTIEGGVINDTTNSGIAGAQKVLDKHGNAKELGPINSNVTKVIVIHAAVPPMLGTTNPNGQVDLNTIWTQTASAANPTTGKDDIWFYFAWTRDANSGSGFLSIELQQSGVMAACDYATKTDAQLIASCNPWANRQAGDFILLWDQQGSSRDIYKRVFAEGVNGALVLEAPVLLGSAKAEFSADGFSGEAAINLTQDVFPSDGSCVTFANTIPGTVTGNSDSADYKDAVLAPFEPVANCGSIIVSKETQPAGETGNFPYTVARSGGQSLRFPADAADYPNDSLTAITRTLTHHGDSETHLDLIPGTNYTLAEDVANIGSQWGLKSITCTVNGNQTGTVVTDGQPFAVEVGKITRCVIVNELLNGTLNIVKTVLNGFGLTKQPGDFSFTLNGGAAQPFANNGTSCTSGSVCKTLTFPIGTAFSVVEQTPLPAGYTLKSSVGCSGTISTTPSTCTITNEANAQPNTVLTIQSAILHDQANVGGVRRGEGEGAMLATFVLYPNLANCQANTGALGSETRPVVFATPTATSGTATTSTGVVVTAASGDYHWRVSSPGNNFNSGFLSDCGRERTVVTFIYNQ